MKTAKGIVYIAVLIMIIFATVNAENIQQLDSAANIKEIGSTGVSTKLKNSNKTNALEGYWQHNVSNHCQKTIASYNFKNDSLITYENDDCHGGISSLYKYRIAKDTIVAVELESYRNIVGHITYHHKNRMIEHKIPLCWFDKMNSCFKVEGINGVYFKNRLVYKGLIRFRWSGPRKR